MTTFELPGYEGLREVAAGGFGVVYRARQVELDRMVAVKVLAVGLDDRSRVRFERECRTMARLSGHPHIVVIHDAGIAAGRPYIVMEYLAAGSLADRLEREGPLGWREATEVGIKVAGALAVAHRAGIVHRDIKPENVLISEFGEPKLGDFGIAQAEDMTKSQSGAVTATVAHAAPEVLAGRGASEASDVYSLASTLYALVAGRAAFVHDSDESVLPIFARAATDPVPDLRPRGIPDALCRVLEGAMAKDPTERPGTNELAERLRGAMTAADTGATVDLGPGTPPPLPDRARPEPRAPVTTAARRRRRRRLVAAAGVLAAVMLAGAVTVIATRGDGDPTVTATVAVGGGPGGVAVADGAVWVANGDDGTVSRLDPATDSVTATIDVGADVLGVAVGEGAVWVTNRADGTVSRLDPATDSVTATIDVGADVLGVAIGEGAVWVTDVIDGTVSRLDPATDVAIGADVGDTIAVGAGAWDVAVGEGAVWVTNVVDDTVSRVDPATGTVTATIEVGADPVSVAVEQGAVWVANFEEGTVLRIDPASATVTATVAVGDAPAGVAVGIGAVWVPNAGDDTVSRIDPATDTVTATIAVGAGPTRVAVGEGAVWVANRDDGTVSRIE